VPIESLVSKIEGLHALGVVSSLKPDFLKKTAEYFSDAADE
jgi:hypothetical protein